MNADYVFSSANTNTAFECGDCSPVIELSVLQCHIIINALSNSWFDRALTDFEQAELDLVKSILIAALEQTS